MSSSIHLVMLTYNRLEYTRRSLPRLLEDPTEEFALTIWDNGSTDGTREYLETVQDPRIVERVLSETNRGQTHVTNKVWSESSADLVGKVDNDCLVTPGWTRILARAHADIPNLGVVGCWHYFPEDFDEQRARHKIQRFGEHQLFRHPWIDGSALLVKRAVYLEFAPCAEKEYLSRFWLRLAARGYINGFYYPLIHQEHMDDPKSRFTLLKDDASLREAAHVTEGLRSHGIDSMDARWEHRRRVLANLLDDPWEAGHYVGFRAKLRSLRERIRRRLG